VLENRVVLSPMCMYSAEDGVAGDFHMVHLGSRIVGGAGLVLTEMTAISQDARITEGCAGLYTDAHVAAFGRIVRFAHQHGTRIGVQLGHAGRKGAVLPPWEDNLPLPAERAWPILSASPLPWDRGFARPQEMTEDDMARVTADYVRATERAAEAGFDWIELHAAHGYLLSSFLSPLTNQRRDAFGGSIEGRMRFPLAVFRAMRARFPKERAMSVRVSASDWAPGGITVEDVVIFARALAEAGCDLISVSSGQTVAEQKPAYGRLFQVPFADAVRSGAGIPTLAVGGITSAGDVNAILAARRADLVALARSHLFDPYWMRHAARGYGFDLPWPKPYGAMSFFEPKLA
jgi:anthraniloyl-CoA monooxygenase